MLSGGSFFMYILIILLSISTTFADIMNLNEYMPTRLEDVSVTRLHHVEAQGTVRIHEEDEELILSPNLRWGLVKRAQLEYNTDYIQTTGDKQRFRSEHKFGLQWNFHDQDDWVPALALDPVLIIPQGPGSKALDSSVKMLLTYTLIGTLVDPIGQFHLNYRWTHNSDRQEDENKIGELLIFGYSHKVGERSSLVADFLHKKDILSSELENAFEAGILHELHEKLHLGLGIGVDPQLDHFSSNLSGEYNF